GSPMRQSTGWALALVLSGMTVPAYGQDKLAWKFKEGDKFYLENVTGMKQTIEVAGQEIKQEIDATMVARFTVKKKTKDGVEMAVKYESVKAKGKGQGIEAVTKIMELIKGAEFTFTLDKDNKVTKFTGYDELIKKITKDDEK